MGMQAPGTSPSSPVGGGGSNITSQPSGSAPPLPGNRPPGPGGQAWIYPRWSFLALILFNIVIVTCYLIELYYSTRPCPLAPTFCQTLDALSPFQVIFAWLLFCILWLLTLLFGIAFLENNSSPGLLARSLLALSQFAPVRPLLIGAGGIAFLFILMNLLAARLSAPALELGGPVILLAIQDLFQALGLQHRDQGQGQQARGQRRQVARQSGTSWYIFRNLPPFTYLIPNRAPRQPAGGAASQPASSGTPSGPLSNLPPDP